MYTLVSPSSVKSKTGVLPNSRISLLDGKSILCRLDGFSVLCEFQLVVDGFHVLSFKNSNYRMD